MAEAESSVLFCLHESESNSGLMEKTQSRKEVWAIFRLGVAHPSWKAPTESIFSQSKIIPRGKAGFFWGGILPPILSINLKSIQFR